MLVVSDRPQYRTHWVCEKWSEEAVDFARKRLDKAGISHVPAEIYPLDVRPMGRINRAISELLGRPVVESRLWVPRMMPIDEGISSEILRAIIGEAEIVDEVEGNLLLNEGIQRLEDLTMIATVLTNQTGGNPWNSGCALGVGDSSTAEAATQTTLSAASNKLYKAMNSTYPSRSSQQISFQSDFLTGEANWVWNEWSVCTTTTDSTGINLNRKVASLGTKSTGTWTLTAQVTLS